MKHLSKEVFADYMRNFIFGVEDSLVSTVGLISGVAVTDASRKSIIITGVVLIFVEAFSMGVGSLLSGHEAREFMKKKELPLTKSMVPGIIMFVSYLLAGIIVLAPYIFISVKNAFPISIIVALVSLFMLGVVGAKMYNNSLIKHGLQMCLLGGVAILLGVVVGSLVNAGMV